MNTRLKFLDRFLTLWIFLAMGIGVFLGNVLPDVEGLLANVAVGTTNIPLAIGLILMMYPPLTKVDFAKIPAAFKNKRVFLASMLITWVIGPFLMFLLAILFLKDYPAYLTGLIIIGLAPCIAMVIVWNDLAGGNRELVAGLVGINSLLQVLFFSAYAYFYLEIMLPLFGFRSIALNIQMIDIAQTVGIYLGIPFVAAVVSRSVLIASKGQEWFQYKFLPKISPITLIALLFTIIVMFSLKGKLITSLPLDVLRVALPLVVFFLVMFFLMFFVAKWLGASYQETATVAFTAAGNNFELAIAVSIGVFGLSSGQALTGVIGPLVEVPALILLVKASFALKSKFSNQ
jgi:ACR3 family arsenite transporter